MRVLDEEIVTNNPPAEGVRADTTSAMRTVIAAAAIVLWFVLVVLGVASVWGTSWQNSYFEAATKVLLPLFNATIAASLTYIFGKPIATALAIRLARPK